MFYITGLLALALAARAAPQAGQKPLSMDSPPTVKVPVVLGVMSACPDALLCESVFDEALPVVADKIDLSLTYVAKINATDRAFGVTCLHGEIECAGNVQQLCAQKYHPTELWWKFVQCQNAAGRYEIGKPELAQKCAVEVGIEWDGTPVSQCAAVGRNGASQEGRTLLRESAITTAAMNIEKSCTVVVNGRHVCVRDSEWKDCEGGHKAEDFVRQIEEEHKRLNKEV